MAQSKSTSVFLGFTRIDHIHFKGFPEVIWGEGKTLCTNSLDHETVEEKRSEYLLITRLEEKKKSQSDTEGFSKEKYYEGQKVLTYLTHPVKLEGKGTILVITAGTSTSPCG